MPLYIPRRHSARHDGTACWRRWLPAMAVGIAVWLASTMTADAADPPGHGLSVFGDLKYGPDFTHFDYVDPAAPKGGTLRLRGIDSFDSLNPFILKGVSPVGIGLMFDSLMTGARDEPDAMYGLIADNAEIAADRGSVIFNLRPQARFSDGTPITADDVVYSFETLVAKGHPRYALAYGQVKSAEALAPYRVKFIFQAAGARELIVGIAGLPVVSKTFFAARPFDQTTVQPLLGSGPYLVDGLEIGRRIVYRRNPDYWARDLPVNRGRYNFDRVHVEYYRDRGIAFEAFLAGEYDFHEEFNSNRWATQYDKPAVEDGRIVRETLLDNRPSGVQAFFLNLRRDTFKDVRVRRALNLAFDFEWTNQALFYKLYRRTRSMFENSALAHDGPPSAAELALLEPLRGQIPQEVFDHAYQPPATDGSGNNRPNLITAARLLKEAGWRVREGRLVDKRGRQMRIEFLIAQASFQRIIGPYRKNLKRLGIDTRLRIVDAANFQQRLQQFDFDVTMRRYTQALTPGSELRGYYGSATADVPGTRNYGGIRNPAVDSLIEHVAQANTRADLTAATRALDRVLMWNHYIIPHWFKGAHNIAYWNKFGRPAVKADFDLGLVDTWWIDASKAAGLDGAAPGPQGETK